MLTSRKFFILMLLALPVAFCFAPKKKNKARAVIESASGSTLVGEALFTQEKHGVKMVLTVDHATPGSHAVHLHEKGDCTAPDATSAGGHWNPTEHAHGNRAGGADFHSGDIANIGVGQNGKGRLEVVGHEWTIGGDAKTDVVGKAVIIHANTDDFVSQPAGNAGARVGCGVVQRMN
jgi:Cu-Zn family superoxide dismutase